jgi:hypothetical protein
MTISRSVATALALVAFTLPAYAQEDSTSARLSTSGWDVEPYIGVAQRSPAGTAWGIITDRSHLFVGVDFRTPVLRIGRVSAYYAPSLTPLLVLSHDRPDGSLEPQRPTAFGIGAAPFGVGLGIAITPRISVLSLSRVGILRFDRVVPVPDASATNVTLEWGAELVWRTRTGRALKLGYKFHHLSNVYTAVENPGVDAHLWTVGYGLLRRGPRSR